MAKVELNTALTAMHGNVGDTIYKTYYRGRKKIKQVVASRRPDMSAVVWSEKQQRHRERMRLFAEYYGVVKADAVQRALYQDEAHKLGHPLSAVVQRDFFRAPTVQSFDVGKFHGRAGDVLTVTVLEPLEAHEAAFSIRAPGGSARETGPGLRDSVVRTVFIYVVQNAVPAGETVLLEVVVSDRPGNAVKASIKWTAVAVPHRVTPSLPPPVHEPPRAADGGEDFRAG